MYDLITPEIIEIRFLLFDIIESRRNKIKEEFLQLIKTELHDLDINQLNLSFYEIDKNDCYYTFKADDSEKIIPIHDLIPSISNKIINCSPIKNQFSNNLLGNKILVRYNGEVYSCSGFSHSCKIGNIYDKSLKEIISTANDNPFICQLFSRGIKESYDYYSKKYSEIKNLRIHK